MIGPPHFATAFATAFLATSVEAIEAMTVVLAAGITRGWPSAIAGAGAGTVVLAAIVALLGPSLAQVPLAALQLATGALLLLFGMRWLRKSMLRYAGVIRIRDEAEIYARERHELGSGAASKRIDPITALAVFKVVMLEGTEVIVILIGIGATSGMLLPASAGALAAILAVIGAGVVLHRPLARVPANALKFAVGVIVSAFGVFWFGEGVGIEWPHGDAAIAGLVVLMLAGAAAGIGLGRRALGAR